MLFLLYLQIASWFNNNSIAVYTGVISLVVSVYVHSDISIINKWLIKWTVRWLTVEEVKNELNML